ncbi:MAG: hypothetical protein Q8O31_05605 [Rhodocyclaceae bacterium]|nr:hypothetical protein [Rhodocyclaceae bacterium]
MLTRLRKPPSSDWVAVSFSGDRAELARVHRGGSDAPEVQVLAAVPYAKGEERGALKALRKYLTTGRITLLLHSGEYQFLQTDTPSVPAQERNEALRWQIKDMVDFPVEDATLDAVPIPQAAGGRTAQCWVAVAANAVIQSKIHLFQEAKLPLSVIDVPELCQRNVAQLFEEPGRALALLSLTDAGGLLSFTYQGELYGSRRIDISVDQLTNAPPERRESMLDRIGLDVQRSIDNFDRNYASIALTRLLVTPMPDAKGFMNSLRSNISIPVGPMDPTSVLTVKKAPELSDPVRCAQALMTLGGALRDES